MGTPGFADLEILLQIPARAQTAEELVTSLASVTLDDDSDEREHLYFAGGSRQKWTKEQVLRARQIVKPFNNMAPRAIENPHSEHGATYLPTSIV
jgi:hypothetical protein